MKNQYLTGLGIDVSRETLQMFEHYHAEILRWTKHINLVSKSQATELEIRHFRDSAQVFQHLPISTERLADFGSGGGFPGLVLSIIAREHMPNLKVTLVESDTRKSAFLRSIVVDLDLTADILSERIENIEYLDADVITARALAPLDVLMEYSNRHLKSTGCAIFLKGQTVGDEVELAKANWSFQCDQVQSTTSSDSKVLIVTNIQRRSE